MQVLSKETENPMYMSFEESVGLLADKYASDTRLTYRFYSPENLRYLRNKAGFFMHRKPSEEPRIDDLIDETYKKLCQSSESERILDKDDEDFQSYEGRVMRTLYQSDWSASSDTNNKISYSRQWEPLELYFDGKEDDGVIDRSDVKQMVKGDGLDGLFSDIPSLVDDCKGEYADCGLSYVVVIGIMCIFRDLCANTKNPIEVQSVISPLLQSVLGLSEAQIQFMYTGIRNNPNLIELVHEGFKEPQVLVGRVKNITRCGLFFDKAEQLVQERHCLAGVV